jgi:hypothetical protein
LQIQSAQSDRQHTALIRQNTDLTGINKRLRERCRELREHIFATYDELNKYRL